MPVRATDAAARGTNRGRFARTLIGLELSLTVAALGDAVARWPASEPSTPTTILYGDSTVPS